MRKPRPKKRGSRIGFIIDPFRRREIWFESGLEEHWACVLVAKPNVVDVREQQQVKYQSGERSHFFDFIVTWTNGRRTAYAVKYNKDVRQSLRDTLIAVNDTHGDTVADDYRILTEKHFDKVSIDNAKLTLSCWNDFDDEGRQLVRERLSHCEQRIRLGDIGALTGLGNRGYRAALTLFREGTLKAAPGEFLKPSLVVYNCASL